MKHEVLISPYIDMRRTNKKGEHYVKLNVYNPYTKKKKLYATDFSYTESDFNCIYPVDNKPKPRWKEDRENIDAIISLACEVANTIIQKFGTFTFELFENEWHHETVIKPNQNITSYYQSIIADLKSQDRIGTASNYECSLNSITAYHAISSKEPLNFHHITKEWLKGYDKHMITDSGKSKTTVGIYLRPLRAVFNKAISDKFISADLYPFLKSEYTMPASENTKKALTPIQLKLLFDSTPTNPFQLKAKAFWFFSYFCNGMNIKDILFLQNKKIKDNSFTFERAKTINTSHKTTTITVFLNDFTKSVITDYGNPDKSPDAYVFPIINKDLSAELQHNQTKNFVKFVNQHFKLFAKSLDIKEEVSTYFARHTFATNAIKKGMSIEFAGEALGHSDIKTTMNYFAGFDDEVKSEFAKKLMEF
jgi:integrase/recombinase XerD